MTSIAGRDQTWTVTWTGSIRSLERRVLPECPAAGPPNLGAHNAI